MLVLCLGSIGAARAQGSDACLEWVRGESWATGTIFWIDAHDPRSDDRGPGTIDRPWATPGPVRSERTLAGGDVVMFREGVYHEAIRPADAGTGPDRRISFIACPGHSVVIDGSDRLDAAWVHIGSAWSTVAFPTRGPIGGRHDRHLVVANGRVLRPVESVDQMLPGTFHIEDPATGRPELFVRLWDDGDPAAAEMRIGRRGTLFGPPAASVDCPSDPSEGWYRLKGLQFRFGASPAQHGAVCLGGTGVVAEDLVVEWTNGLGIQMTGTGHVLRRSRSVDNGQSGIGGECVDCLLEDVRSDRNNWRGHSRFWEAGGGKWIRTVGTTFRRYSARDNDGVGLWFDGWATGNLVEEADIEGSEMAALMFELASDSNRVVGGRFVGTRYRGWSGSGILIQAAGGNVIERSVVSANEGKGIWVRSDDRVPTGGLTVRGTILDRNGTAAQDGDFEISIEHDVPAGGEPPPYSFKDVLVRPADPRRVLGVARDRDHALTRTEWDRYFGPGGVRIQ